MHSLRLVCTLGILLPLVARAEPAPAFEREVAARCGRTFAVAVSSGTAALELALRALGVDGGEVLVPDLSWPSPAHAVAIVGARPVLVDVRADEWNADAAGLAAGRRAATRAAIVIDQFGVPARVAHVALLLVLTHPGSPLRAHSSPGEPRRVSVGSSAPHRVRRPPARLLAVFSVAPPLLAGYAG